MARKLKVGYPGANCQVMSRGVGVNPSSRRTPTGNGWWTPLGEACVRSGWPVPAYGGEARQESQAEKAERVVAEELRRRG